MKKRVAVIGAGISGLVCARTLAVHGIRTTVFEKARGPGGRMSTRRETAGSFDHGAQYLTARDPRFASAVEAWRADGVVATWDAAIVALSAGGRVKPLSEPQPERLVGVPSMSAITRELTAGLDVRFETRICAVDLDSDGFLLHDGKLWVEEMFDGVVLAVPGPQAAELLEDQDPIGKIAAASRLAPCLAVMVRFAARVDVPFDAAFVEDGWLAWVARNSSKPGRAKRECWVLHAMPGWSREHFDDPEFASALLDAFEDAVAVTLPEVVAVGGHRWRYALPVEPLTPTCLFDRERRLGACGDWCGGPRVEGAYLSGLELGERVLESFGIERLE